MNAGDLLFRIDPEPYRIAIAQNDAAIAAAQVKVIGMETELSNTGVDINGASEDVAFYEQEYRRQSELMQRGFTTRARLQAAQHALSDARTKLGNAQADAAKARAALATAPVAPGVNPALLAAQAQRRKAMLDLARTDVRAPVSGTVTQADRLQLGQMMTSGLPALTIVVSDKSWIEANFKETDLAQMHVGQPARLTFDAYPEIKLKGHIASIGAGTGSEFIGAAGAERQWQLGQSDPARAGAYCPGWQAVAPADRRAIDPCRHRHQQVALPALTAVRRQAAAGNKTSRLADAGGGAGLAVPVFRRDHRQCRIALHEGFAGSIDRNRQLGADQFHHGHRDCHADMRLAVRLFRIAQSVHVCDSALPGLLGGLRRRDLR